MKDLLYGIVGLAYLGPLFLPRYEHMCRNRRLAWRGPEL